MAAGRAAWHGDKRGACVPIAAREAYGKGVRVLSAVGGGSGVGVRGRGRGFGIGGRESYKNIADVFIAMLSPFMLLRNAFTERCQCDV